jgi:hypothetical protein
VQPQLSPRAFPSIFALGTLLHGGILLLPNPIFRSGEDCRHSNLNNPQDIAPEAVLVELYANSQKGGRPFRRPMARAEALVGAVGSFTFAAQMPSTWPITEVVATLCPKHPHATSNMATHARRAKNFRLNRIADDARPDVRSA